MQFNNLPFFQSKLNDELNSAGKAMEHRVELKIEEIKGEIKFLMGAIEWVESDRYRKKPNFMFFRLR